MIIYHHISQMYLNVKYFICISDYIPLVKMPYSLNVSYSYIFWNLLIQQIECASFKFKHFIIHYPDFTHVNKQMYKSECKHFTALILSFIQTKHYSNRGGYLTLNDNMLMPEDWHNLTGRKCVSNSGYKYDEALHFETKYVL